VDRAVEGHNPETMAAAVEEAAERGVPGNTS
jgi:hypothetical protein